MTSPSTPATTSPGTPDAPARSRLSRILHSRLAWAGAGVGAVALTAGLVLFEPWALWVDNTVVEAVPGTAAPVAAAPVAAAPVAAAQPAAGLPSVPIPAADAQPAEPASAEPVVDYRGSFISHEHATTGTVRILRLADGSRVLRLEDLDTSNGPDLKVLLSDAAVKPGRAGWHVFDDNAHVSLGSLKGNKGSQNYAIPSDVDLGAYRSVSIWCDRFNVSFGATELERVAA